MCKQQFWTKQYQPSLVGRTLCSPQYFGRCLKLTNSYPEIRSKPTDKRKRKNREDASPHEEPSVNSGTQIDVHKISLLGIQTENVAPQIYKQYILRQNAL